jgi:hypothetical protein
MGGVAVLFRPIDCVSLCFERGEYVVDVIFDHIIVDMGPFGTALGSRFNVNVRHALFSLETLDYIGARFARSVMHGPAAHRVAPSMSRAPASFVIMRDRRFGVAQTIAVAAPPALESARHA